MILTDLDLLAAEKEGKIAIKNRLEFGAFSLDIRIDRLYRRKDQHAPIMLDDGNETTSEEYIAKELEEVPIPPQGIVISSNDYYNWKPVEHLFLAPGYRGRICSRSSYARLGSQALSADERLREHWKERTFTPLCELNTTGTTILIKRGEPLAQLIIETPEKPMNYWHETKQLWDENKLIVKRGKKKLKSTDVDWPNGFILTQDSPIKIYKGGLLTPGKPPDNDFETCKLPKKGLWLPQGTFFISASKEALFIPKTHAGYVDGHPFLNAQPRLSERDELYGIIPFNTHANAPYIGPNNVFTGKITFENIMRFPALIFPAMPISEAHLIPLVSPSTYGKESRYHGQSGATTSKL